MGARVALCFGPSYRRQPGNMLGAAENKIFFSFFHVGYRFR